MNCPGYIVPPGFQLQSGGVSGPSDCTAWAARVVIATASCGAEVPSGRIIRLQSNEPIPDRNSPGLNLVQVADVAAKYGVHFDVRIGFRSVTFAEYERRRLAGQPAIIQVRYAAIASSKYDAGGGFQGNHAIAETTHATYDSLADGRRPGIHKFDGTVYPRALIQTAAARLDIGGGNHPAPGTVWAAFAPDVVPSYHVVIKPKPPAKFQAFGTWKVTNGVITSGKTRNTTGYDNPCSPPQWVRVPGDGLRQLVHIDKGSLTGLWVWAGWAKEL